MRPIWSSGRTATVTASRFTERRPTSRTRRRPTSTPSSPGRHRRPGPRASPRSSSTAPSRGCPASRSSYWPTTRWGACGSMPSRSSVGGFAVGMAWAALDAARSHAAGRAAFGRPIREFQAVSHPLAEMATRTEAARLMVYAAAAAYDRGAPDVTRRSAMAKLFATETAQWVVDAAVQIHGARALQRGHLLEKLYREGRAPRIYEGTTEIQREVIARDLFR